MVPNMSGGKCLLYNVLLGKDDYRPLFNGPNYSHLPVGSAGKNFAPTFSRTAFPGLTFDRRWFGKEFLICSGSRQELTYSLGRVTWDLHHPPLKTFTNETPSLTSVGWTGRLCDATPWQQNANPIVYNWVGHQTPTRQFEGKWAIPMHHSVRPLVMKGKCFYKFYELS